MYGLNTGFIWLVIRGKALGSLLVEHFGDGEALCRCLLFTYRDK
jgi:hypothetical protein